MHNGCLIELHKLDRNIKADLDQARALAHAVRFPGDKRFLGEHVFASIYDKATDHFLRTGLLVDETSAPLIDKCVGKACARLSLPRHLVSVFVRSDPNIQASCLSISKNECIVELSSGLVNLLNGEELTFIIGHEIGHHLLEHYMGSMLRESVELYLQKRAQEISVDRIGLICCEEISHAMSAMLKTVSGLNNAHLGFNIGAYIAQARKLSRPAMGENPQSTHPSLLIRCRALLWFFEPNLFQRINTGNLHLDLTAINKRVQDEMFNLVDAPVHQRLTAIETEISMWMTARSILTSGRFKKEQQTAFRDRFGTENLAKFKNLLLVEGKSDVAQIVDNQLSDSIQQLQNLMPESAEKRIAAIKNRAEGRDFKISD